MHFSTRRESNTHKLKTFLHYFDRLARGQVETRNHVTFERRCLSHEELPDWRMSLATFENSLVVDDEGKIEDAGRGMLQVGSFTFVCKGRLLITYPPPGFITL